jgi:hypothetical protein
MFKLRFILTFFILITLNSGLFAKTEKVDQLLVVRQKISQAYELGYVDAAPIETSNIEKKVLQAKQAKENRKKKLFNTLIEQIKVDLKIVKKRYEVNKLNQQLTQLQADNLQSKRMLDELKGQL